MYSINVGLGAGEELAFLPFPWRITRPLIESSRLLTSEGQNENDNTRPMSISRLSI